MNTIEKGDLAESLVISEALKRGYDVCVPFSSRSRYDLVIDRNGNLEKVQVKFVTPVKGTLPIPIKTMSYDSSKGQNNRSKMTVYEEGDFDWIAAVDAETFNVYFIPAIEAIGNCSMSIRLEVPKNGQVKGIRMASSYTEW